MLGISDALLKGIESQILKLLGPGSPAKPSSSQTSALLKSSLILPSFTLQLLSGVTPPSFVLHSPVQTSVLAG